MSVFWVFMYAGASDRLQTREILPKTSHNPAALARLFCKKIGNEHLKANLERVSSLGHVTDKMLGGGGEGGFS